MKHFKNLNDITKYENLVDDIIDSYGDDDAKFIDCVDDLIDKMDIDEIDDILINVNDEFEEFLNTYVNDDGDIDLNSLQKDIKKTINAEKKPFIKNVTDVDTLTKYYIVAFIVLIIEHNNIMDDEDETEIILKNEDNVKIGEVLSVAKLPGDIYGITILDKNNNKHNWITGNAEKVKKLKVGDNLRKTKDIADLDTFKENI